MTESLPAPSASDPREEQADWLELLALAKKDLNSSLEDLVRQHRRSGSTDGLGGIDTATDRGSERAQQVAEEAMAELSDRTMSCGGRYPFRVEERYIQARKNSRKSIYVFLLALTRWGKDAGPVGTDAADLFERVCAKAAEEYLGGTERGARSYLFGFPRRVTLPGFRAALDDLCQQMGEGGGCRERPTTSDQKDAELDLAAWRGFDDRRAGQLIALGQCATGGNWNEKISVLHNFPKKWMIESPLVEHVRMFFFPRRLELHKWEVTVIDAGIAFDRCRIAALVGRVDSELRSECAEWTQHVLEENLYD